MSNTKRKWKKINEIGKKINVGHELNPWRIEWLWCWKQGHQWIGGLFYIKKFIKATLKFNYPKKWDSTKLNPTNLIQTETTVFLLISKIPHLNVLIWLNLSNINFSWTYKNCRGAFLNNITSHFYLVLEISIDLLVIFNMHIFSICFHSQPPTHRFHGQLYAQNLWMVSLASSYDGLF